MSQEIEWGNWEPSKSKPSFTFDEIANQEYDRFNKAEKVSSYVEGAIGAYDRRNDDIFKATGEKLFNPLRDIPSEQDLAEMQSAYRDMVGGGMVNKSRAAFQEEWFASRYDQRLKDIATKYPHLASVVKADRSPILDHAEAAQRAEQKSAEMADRLGMVDVRESMPSLKKVPVLPDIANLTANIATNPTATVAQFWGGFKAQMQDPVEASMNLLGFGAGRASMSVLKTAMLNAAANAAVEAAANPLRQYNRKEMGLDYGWDRFFADVSGAAATGAMLDAGVRIPYRAAITRFGRDVPEGQMFSKQGRGGILTDAIPQMDPIKPVVREKITPEEIERAKANDIDAIESIAKKSGIYDDPSIKGMLDHAKLGGRIDDEMVKRFEAMKIDHGEGMATLRAAIEVGGLGYARMPDPITQAARALDTAGAAELAPRLAEIDQRLAEAPQNVRQAIRAGIEAGIPEIVDAARKAVSGDLEGMRKAIADAGGEQALTDRVIVHTATNPISVALALRRSPGVMDSNVSLRTDMMRMARAIAALDEPAFRMVLEGKAHPLAGQIVADMVPPGRHAQVLEQVANFRSMEDAKAAIPDLIPEPSRAPEATGTRVSDPAGPEAKAQIEDLEKAHKAEVDRATEPARKREELESKVETLKGEIAKLEEQQGKLFAIKDGDKLSIDQKIKNWEDIDKFFQSLPKETRRQIEDGFDVVRSTSNNYVNYDVVESGKPLWADNGSSNSLGTFAVKASQRLDVAGVESTNSRLTESLQRKGIGTKVYDLIDADMKQVGGLSPSPRDQLSPIAVSFWQKRLGNDMFAIADRGKATLDETILSPPEQKLLAKLTERTGLKPEDVAEQRAQGQSFGKKIDAALDKATKFEGAEKAADELATKRQELRAAERELEQVQLDQARMLQDPALFNAVMRRAALQRQLDVRRAIDDALRLGDQMLPEGTRVEVRTDEMVDPASGYRLDASSDMATGDIALASYALNPAGRIGHEGVHTLITKGHIAPEEVKLLAKMARERGLFKDEAKYREAYAGRDNIDALIDEEAAAHAIEARINGTDIGPANTMADRIKQLIERIKNALDGYGFKTADDVARAIIEGRAAEREARAEWMRGEARQMMRDAAERGVTLPDGTQIKGVPLYAIRAFHGSPHDFDKFDINRYGTGDGMDNIKGIWVSESRDVGASYQGRMDRSGVAEGSSELISHIISTGVDQTTATLAAWHAAQSGGIGPAIDRLLASIKRDTARGLPTDVDQRALSALTAATGYSGPLTASQPTARLYEVNVSADLSEMIDISRPLSQQSAIVRQLASEYGASNPRDIYGKVIAKHGMDAGTSELLMRGVKGMSYIDNEFSDNAMNYVVFDDSLIEIVAKDGKPVNREQMFALADTNTGRSMRADLDRLGYYSKALEAAKSLKQAKGTPEQMLAQLKAAGVKDAEIEATNLRSFLDGKTSITRDEIVKHLTGNRVGVREVGRSKAPADDWMQRQYNDVEKEYEKTGKAVWNGKEYQTEADLIAAIEQGARERAAAGEFGDVVKWSSYSLDPSNPTYRETVLHLPRQETAALVDTREEMSKAEAVLRSAIDEANKYSKKKPLDFDELMNKQRYYQDADINSLVMQAGGEWIQRSKDGLIGKLRHGSSAADNAKSAWDGLETAWGNFKAAREKYDNAYADVRRGEFQSGHFSEPNIIGHMMTSMNRHEGKPVFTLDQIQSDWGQKLRDGGVRDEAKIAELKPLLDAANKKKEDAFRALDRADKAKNDAYERANEEYQRIAAEYHTAATAAPGHPLVNTTDQWTNTTLRRALRQAAEADAEFIAIPSGDTVLSYNPGDNNGMRQFYGAQSTHQVERFNAATRTVEKAEVRQPVEGIVPKNLRKLLEKIDKDSAKPALIDKLETPSGMKGSGFTLFPLTDKVKRSVMEEGQALFALSREPLDMSPEARKARAEQMGFDTGKVWYHGTKSVFDEFDLKKFGVSDQGLAGKGAYFTYNPEEASGYALNETFGNGNNPNVVPVYLAVKNPFVITHGVLPDGRTLRDIHAGSPITEKGGNAIREMAENGGHDGIAFANRDGQPVHMVVFDPTNIRSVNATFDPAEAGSARLLAAFNDNTPPDPLKSDMAVVDRMNQLKDLIEACRA